MFTERNPFNLQQRLTKEDCKKGFHLYRHTEKLELSFIETCITCGKKIYYDKFSKDNKGWAANHKLDLLQPYGETAKDFYYYYGQPTGIPKDFSQKKAGKFIQY